MTEFDYQQLSPSGGFMDQQGRLIGPATLVAHAIDRFGRLDIAVANTGGVSAR